MYARVPWRVLGAFATLLSLVFVGVIAAYRAGTDHSAAAWEQFETPASQAPTTATDVTKIAAPRRVIALSLAAEEIVLDLSGPPVLVAVSPLAKDERYSNVVAKAVGIEKTVNAQSVERIVRLAPQCVLAASYTDPTARRILRRVNIPIVELPEPRSFENVRQAIALVGRTLGREVETQALRERFDAQLERTRKRAAQALSRVGRKRPEVLYVGTDLNRPWIAGRDTLADEILCAAGAVNVAARHGVVHAARLNKEAILRWNPEFLLFDGEPAERATRLQELESDPVFADLSATRARKVILVPTRLMTAASHYVATAAERLCDALYQEPPNQGNGGAR